MKELAQVHKSKKWDLGTWLLWVSNFHDPNIKITVFLKENLNSKKKRKPKSFGLFASTPKKVNICVMCILILPYLMSQNTQDVVIIISILSLIPQDQTLASNLSLSDKWNLTEPRSGNLNTYLFVITRIVYIDEAFPLAAFDNNSKPGWCLKIKNVLHLIQSRDRYWISWAGDYLKIIEKLTYSDKHFLTLTKHSSYDIGLGTVAQQY